MTGNAKMRTAAVWLLGLASAASVGCTVYEPGLLPDDVDAGIADARPDRGRDAARDVWEAEVAFADADDASIDGEDDGQADVWASEPTDAVDESPADGPPVCDAACLMRCADRVMNGSETRIDCGGECPPEMCPPAPVIADLVVNDMNMGQDGVANNYQWRAFPSFAEGLPVFGDRPYTVTNLPPEAKHLIGKPWIRTAADSKLYSTSTPPVATATVSGSFIYILMDERQAQMPLASDGYMFTGSRFEFTESDGIRNYSVWRKPIATSPSSASFPTVSSVASFYIIVVE